MRRQPSIKQDQWTPLTPAPLPPGHKIGLGDEAFAEVWRNEIYTVLVRKVKDLQGNDGYLHLSIRRNDREHLIDWRHKQYIKNQIAGEHREAIEIFPSEKRLLDTSNQFHLWVLPEDAMVPVGYTDPRCVAKGGIGKTQPWRQRPFEKGLEPDDAIDMNEVMEALNNES